MLRGIGMMVRGRGGMRLLLGRLMGSRSKSCWWREAAGVTETFLIFRSGLLEGWASCRKSSGAVNAAG
jgi:hypothetical protein